MDDVPHHAQNVGMTATERDRDGHGDIGLDAEGGSPAPLSVPIDPEHRSSFPPIDDYAFLSDCETTCLIARNGSVEWMCLPRPDSPSVFGSVLDRSAGHFRVGPYGRSVPAARRYLPGGLIVETTWQTETGWLIVRDALVMVRGTTTTRVRTVIGAPRRTGTPSTCCCARSSASAVSSRWS